MNMDIINFPKARVRKAMREKRRKGELESKIISVALHEIKLSQKENFNLEIKISCFHLVNVCEKIGLLDLEEGPKGITISKPIGSTVISEPMEPIECECTVL